MLVKLLILNDKSDIYYPSYVFYLKFFNHLIN